VAANLALLDTHAFADAAERVLAAGADPTLALEQLRHAVAQAVAEIAQFAPQEPMPPDRCAPQPPSGQVALSVLLQDLLVALGGDNPGPVEPVLAALEKHLPPPQLDSLVACVRGFDFRGAEACALALATQHGISPKRGPGASSDSSSSK
jgi:hypothetical protein